MKTVADLVNRKCSVDPGHKTRLAHKKLRGDLFFFAELLVGPCVARIGQKADIGGKNPRITKAFFRINCFGSFFLAFSI